MRRSRVYALLMCVAGAGLISSPGAWAQTVMQQCSQQYQAAKAGGTLNGMTWNQFRSDCASKLKAQPATAGAATPAAQPVAASTPVSNPLNPSPAGAAPSLAAPAETTTAAAPAATTAPVATGGRAAFQVRQKQCGAEWRANKVSLKAQTPGLTWPKYLSQCNARLKAAGK